MQKLEKHDEARAAYLKGLKLNPMNQNLKAAVAAEDKALGYDQQHEHIQGADGMAADDDEEQDLYVILGLSKAFTDAAGVLVSCVRRAGGRAGGARH